MRIKRNEETFRRVCQFYVKNGGNDRHKDAISATIRHFVEEGMHKQVVSVMIKRFRITGSDIHLKPSGRPRKWDHKKVAKLYKRKPDTSLSEGASLLQMPRSTFKHIKCHNLNIKGYSMTEVPKYINNQEKRAKTGCRKLYDKFTANKVLIIDDEMYVPTDPKLVKVRQFYHSKAKGQVKDKFRFKPKQKFKKQFLIWQAIDSDGNVSEPFISNGTINGAVYLEECIKKRLLPFIHKYHSTEDVLFWPDLATAHYANVVQKFLIDNNIECVKRKDNPPSVPQVRPIERFWALC